MSDLIFYGKPVVLDSGLHQSLHVKATDGFAFAAKTNSVPVVGVEFADVCRELPLVFVKGADGAFVPVALLGLRDNENLLVSADGRWDGRYVPAFIRRYPFAPALADGGNLLVCIDETASCLNGEEGEPLFRDGQPSPFLQDMMNLLQDYQAQAQRTEQFCKRLQEYGLLAEFDAHAQLPDGASYRLAGLHVVEEKRLQALDRDKVQELFASGELGLVYAHLLSLGNLRHLMDKLGERLQG